MKFFLTLSVISICLVLDSCKKNESEPETALVKNGNVEQKFEGWNFFDTSISGGSSAYAMGFTDEAASSPRYSLKINCNEARSDTAFSYFGQHNISTAGIPIGAKITLKAKVKTVDIKGEGISIALRGDKARKIVFFETTENKAKITGTKDFTEYTATLNSYPGDIDDLMIFLVYLPGTTGQVYFDDISLTIN